MQGNAPGTGYGPPPNAPFAPPPRRTSWLAVSLAALAVVLAAVALVLSLVRKPEAPAPAAPPTPTPTADIPAQELFVEAADRALCQAIAPLMKEASERNKAFGPLVPGSPEQAAAIPDYRSFVEDWANKIQQILNQHLDPPRYLTRTLQAYIDDNLLYVELVKPGRVDAFDHATWEQGAVDYGGPLGTCSKLGVNW